MFQILCNQASSSASTFLVLLLKRRNGRIPAAVIDAIDINIFFPLELRYRRNRMKNHRRDLQSLFSFIFRTDRIQLKYEFPNITSRDVEENHQPHFYSPHHHFCLGGK
ncbi:hypothetical protein AVEN_270099-1 [Araneus ventricosus]|uniref:Uncharacterized protein n=1 Tax=Araneus ventricosus TaxID=182803 RepID=A0A4Y2LP18_ARAVE|nr:hypothetical protein AVEN_270099-1 [Araneus ventricosus]